MKWMGGWSYQDLCQCPDRIVQAIIARMNEEADAANDLPR